MEEKTGEIETEKQKQKFSLKREIWEFFKFAVLAVIIVAPIRLWIAQPFIVSGSSMVPTFHDGDYLIINEIGYRFEEPERDEVIVFRYPKNPSQFYIKRIIGLPGETINGTTLGENEYYVMGDNRNASSDSRYWGPLKRNLIIGRAAIRLWPVAGLGLL